MPVGPSGASVSDYTELHCHSNFSFLDGAAHPEDLVARAAALGYRGLAITDRDGLYAVVRLHTAAQEQGIDPIVGSTITLEDESRLTLLATDVSGYQSLSQLITAGRRARPKGSSSVTWEQLEQHRQGLLCLSGGLAGPVSRALLQPRPSEECLDQAGQLATRLLDLYGAGQVYLELSDHLLPIELMLKGRLVELARRLDLPLVATQEARYALPEGQALQDVLTCIRHHTTLQEAGTRLLPNGQYFLQPREVLSRRFRDLPQALRNTEHIRARCSFRLDQLNFSMPDFPIPVPFRSMLEYLEHLTFLYAPSRFPAVESRVVGQLRHELEVIGRHRLEGYFLIVWDIMKFCHDQGILAQGRGSAANSAVCFALGITNVDPIRHGLLFERFLSEGRSEAPDIDLDIANDRREEVIQYVYGRYGREHAGMVCEVICFRARSAVRDVGKALGLSLDQVDRIAKNLDRWHRRSDASETTVREMPSATETVQDEEEGGDPEGSDLPEDAAQADRDGVSRADSIQEDTVSTHSNEDSAPEASRETTPHTSEEIPSLSEHETRTANLLWKLCEQLEGFPRHLGIHVGGMIICATSLSALVPIENATMADRTVVQWDKDDVGALKMPKIDLLGLGMLSMIGEALEIIQVYDGRPLDPSRLRYDDPAVYDLMCEADTVGLFQVESRAQMNVLPRLKPRCFYDLVVQVSLIRPGPIQGEMVHPYLRRREGREAIEYPHPDLEPILARTLGIPLFQEQGMKVAITAAGFSPSEADALRRAMGSKRSRSLMESLTGKLFNGMKANGYGEEIALRVVNQIKAFASYGFPESHAASFALLVYVSAHLKRYHPLAFYTALLNNQPMGFYSPATIVNEAKRKGHEVLPVDLTRSGWEWTIEDGRLRAGLCSVRGLGPHHRTEWDAARAAGPWRSVEDVCMRLGWPRLLLERLAAVGAFRGLGVDRREAIWRVQGHRPRVGLAAPAAQETPTPLRPLPRAEALAIDLRTAGHSTESHPITFLRPTLHRWGVLKSDELLRTHTRAPVRVAGVVTVRQRPPTAKGFCFLTLEDERGMINVIVRPDKYEEYRPVVRRAMLLLIEGRLQRQNGVANVMAEKIAALDERWVGGVRSRDFH